MAALAGFRPRYFDQSQKRAFEYGCQPARLLDVEPALSLLDLGDGLLLPAEACRAHAGGDVGLTDLQAATFGADVTANDFLVSHGIILSLELPGGAA